MGSVTIALITLASAFGGAMAGALIRSRLPEHHLREDSKDVVKMGAGVIATLTALVLGLLINSAINSFDAINDGLAQCGTDIIMLDRDLAQYGSEANDARRELRRTVAGMIGRLWPEEKVKMEGPGQAEGSAGLTAVHNRVLALSPQNESQRSLQAQAIETLLELRQSRLKISERSEVPAPTAFLIVLVFWLAVLFASFGLLAPANPTSMTVLFLCAVSVAGAMFLLVEMSHPTTGLMRVSSAPLVKAFGVLGR